MSGYFFSQKHLAEFRHMVDVFNAWKRRNGEVPGSYEGVHCGCGCGPFISKRDTELSPPKPPQPKKPTKRSKKTHPMFSGNVV